MLDKEEINLSLNKFNDTLDEKNLSNFYRFNYQSLSLNELKKRVSLFFN